MKVSDILRVKGNTLYTVTSTEPLAKAVDIMAERDIGSPKWEQSFTLSGQLKKFFERTI